MRPAYGRLPRGQIRAVHDTVREFIPICRFGVAANAWQPNSTSETVQCLYVNDKLDLGSDIGLRVLWSSSSATTTDTATHRILYTKVQPDSGTLPGLAATVLSTAITADAVVGANVLQKSPAGVISGGTITDNDALVLALNVNAVSGLAIGAVAVYGVEIEYVTTYVG